MSRTVTATSSGTGSQNGIALTVKVLDGAASVQNGASANSDVFTTPEEPVTPHATGSYVYGAVIQGASDTTFTAAATTTFSQNIADATHGAAYGTFRSTSTTTASTPVTVGASAPTIPSGEGNIAAAEILASGTLSEDASSPAGVSSTSAKTITTAAFTPPAGTLLVAQVAANYSGSGSVTMTVSDTGGLSWTKLVADPVGLASVWVALVPLARSASLTVTPSLVAQAVRGHYRGAALPVVPSFLGGRARGRSRGGSLTVIPAFASGRVRGRVRSASLTVMPAFGAGRTALRFRGASLLVTPQFLAVPSGGAAPVAQTGSWWGLDTVLKQSTEEFREFVSRPPVACPRDGEPLMPGPSTPAGASVELFCRYCFWQYPRDYERPERPGLLA